jgi:DNA (cytosine-5)-methyltransferase 1
MNSEEKTTGIWFFKNTKFKKNKGTVFSCFSCCGGSTMGYKLAGFDVIGCNEIDPKVMEVYKANHKPLYSYTCSIRDMLKIKQLPKELFNLDILDGSPPCTSFSTAGVRERDWGKAKKFSEGQALQRLDDLFFEFIALANRLKPKVVLAENVSGIIKGKAKGYIKEIVQAYSDAGYNTQIFRLNGANMGIAQSRDRVFFVSTRKDYNFEKLKLNNNEKIISLERKGEGRIKQKNIGLYVKKEKNLVQFIRKKVCLIILKFTEINLSQH